jgi:hypothetical protein
MLAAMPRASSARQQLTADRRSPGGRTKTIDTSEAFKTARLIALESEYLKAILESNNSGGIP